MRRRGYTPEAIRDFCDRIGVAKTDSTVDVALLEHCLREDLNKRAPRVMGVLQPLRVVIENYPEGQVEELEAVNNPEDPAAGTRKVPFSRVLYIEQDDFREVPPPKYFRLAPGREVRLRYAYFIKCVDVVEGRRRARWSSCAAPTTRPRAAATPRTAARSRPPSTGSRRPTPSRPRCASTTASSPRRTRTTRPRGRTSLANLNPNSLEVLTGCRVEPSLAGAAAGYICQFERQGYFCVDPDSSGGQLVFNRAVQLRDEWAKIERSQRKG